MPLPPPPLKSTSPLSNAAVARGPEMTTVSFSKPFVFEKAAGVGNVNGKIV